MNICGIDEVGRGCLAGPVAAAAVVLGVDFPEQTVCRLADSKTLTANQRENISLSIFMHARVWGIAWATVAEIDEHNILRASLIAMQRAYHLIARMPLACEMVCGYGTNAKDYNTIHPIDEIIVDGTHAPTISSPYPIRCMVKADTCVPAVQAAAIIAKVARDRLLTIYDTHYPLYGFRQHKGYPTQQHRAAIQQHGILPIHRRSFKLINTQ